MSKHNWQYTTNTMATMECTNCDAVAFSPHTPPEEGCDE